MHIFGINLPPGMIRETAGINIVKNFCSNRHGKALHSQAKSNLGRSNVFKYVLYFLSDLSLAT